jgi:membrane-associated protease RseP (regulator of RpoE activity)
MALGVVFLLLPAAARGGDERRAEGRERGRERVRVVVPEQGRTILLDAGRRGYFGVHVVELTPELRQYFRAGEAGVLISKVEADSPAARAGVQVGDVLADIDGEAVESGWDLRQAVSPHEEGDAVAATVIRDGRSRELTVTLAEREGRVLELGRLMQRDGEGRPLLVLPSAGEWEELGEQMGAFGEEMGELGEEVGEAIAEAFADPDVRFRVEREVQRRGELQRKIELLERRLRELERQLADQRR